MYIFAQSRNRTEPSKALRPTWHKMCWKFWQATENEVSVYALQADKEWGPQKDKQIS